MNGQPDIVLSKRTKAFVSIAVHKVICDLYAEQPLEAC